MSTFGDSFGIALWGLESHKLGLEDSNQIALNGFICEGIPGEIPYLYDAFSHTGWPFIFPEKILLATAVNRVRKIVPQGLFA